MVQYPSQSQRHAHSKYGTGRLQHLVVSRNLDYWWWSDATYLTKRLLLRKLFLQRCCFEPNEIK